MGDRGGVNMAEEDSDSKDRIDPVTGIRTGESSTSGTDAEEIEGGGLVKSLNSYAEKLNTLMVPVSILLALAATFIALSSSSVSSTNNSLFSEIIPTMTQSWITLSLFIVFGISGRRVGGRLYRIIEPIIVPGKVQKKESAPFSSSNMASDWYKSFQSRWLAAPNNISMAMSSAWRGRERGLAIFAGVFLSSLVITTVLAYAVGLNQAFFAFSLEGDEFDAKVDFQSDPDGSWEGRTNDSAIWESLCDDLVEMEEFADCGLVFGRQGLRLTSFFDPGFAAPQPLNVEAVSSQDGEWGNISWDFPEAIENGPPINSKRIIRFYGDGIWDGELGDRHAKSVIFGEWPSTAEDARANRTVVLPSKIASQAGVVVNDTIDSLTFSYVTATYEGLDISQGYQECQTDIDLAFNDELPLLFCKENITVTDLTVSAIYEEGDFGNPTLLFHPVIVSDSVLSDTQKTTLMQSDHGYLGIAVDRTEIPTASTRAATSWLEDLKTSLESVRATVDVIDPSTGEATGETEKVSLPREFTVGEGANAVVLSIQYNDIISGTITFLNIFLGIIQVFDYILVIPIVALSFVVLIYGLVLSLEQRRREVAIHRVIGGTEATLSRMMVLEIYAIGTVAWILGFSLASGAVEVVLRAVGFLRFTDAGDIDVDPVLSFGSTFVVTLLTVGLAWFYGKNRTNDFLSIEIDEGVRRVKKEKRPNYLLHWVLFGIGMLAYVESWIQNRGGFWIWDGGRGGGIVEPFIPNAIIQLLGPFFLWIGGALVLSRIGASGPQILNRAMGWSPAVSDIRRGLSGSGSSQSVSRLSLIMLLTLSIVTLAAVQGHTGTLVDERTTDAQNGADLRVQFDSGYTEQEAMTLVMSSIASVGDSEIDDVNSMTSIGNIIATNKDGGGIYPVWVLFDGHEDTLLWDEQSIPGDDPTSLAQVLSQGGYLAGPGARNQLDRPSTGSPLTLQYSYFNEGPFGLPVEVGPSESVVNYAGRVEWIPGLSATEVDNTLVIGEKTYNELVVNLTSDIYKSTTWMFDLCDQRSADCASALELLSADLRSVEGIISAQDWSSAHEGNERNGGLIFGTPGLLSMMFVVAALASVSSAFVFLSLVLSQRKRELAILQAIGASPNQVIRLVLFEIMSILLVSMVLGVSLGLAVSESFNGFFGVFGFIFQLFLGQSAPIDRDLVWPWAELVLVNGMVLIAVVLALLVTTRRALGADLATVLKGE